MRVITALLRRPRGRRVWCGRWARHGTSLATLPCGPCARGRIAKLNQEKCKVKVLSTTPRGVACMQRWASTLASSCLEAILEGPEAMKQLRRRGRERPNSSQSFMQKGARCLCARVQQPRLASWATWHPTTLAMRSSDVGMLSYEHRC